MKQVILVRQDLKLPNGKACVQCSHASVEAVLKSDASKVKSWRKEGMPKIALKISDLKELYKYNQLAKDSGLITAVITDAGKTVVEPGTVTCFAIGPDDDDKIDAITGKLSML